MNDERSSRRWRGALLILAALLVLASAGEALVPSGYAAERERDRGSSRTEQERVEAAREALAAWQRSDVGTEVVGGTPVPQGRFTFMTLVLFEADGGMFQCGGSLIAPAFVLTAAHCVEDPMTSALLPPGAFTLFIGRANLNEVGPGNVRGVVEVFQHPAWNPDTLRNDVAVLELDAPVPASIAQPLPFVSAGQTTFNTPGTAATVAGWGRISTTGPTSVQLREADVAVVSDAACGAAYEGEFDAAVMLCAALPARDACFGDSGGPLMAKQVIGHKVKKKRKHRKHRKHGKHRKHHKHKKRKVRKKRVPIFGEIQIGIVSFGAGACADPAHPGVYTRVSAPGINDFIVASLNS